MMNEYDKIIRTKKNLPHFPDHPGQSANPKKELLVYQYRNLDNFWQIVKNDSLWATNARFSNDEAEQRFGMEVIASLCDGQIDDNDLEKAGLDENYITCFCLDDDKLSQWRGYASECGVALGFDFGMPRAFSVLHKEVDDNYDSSQSELMYIGLNSVCYLDPKNNQQSREDYIEYCKKELSLLNPTTDEDKKAVYEREIRKKAPYIKHSGFMEEAEYRLVFQNEDGILDKCVRYRKAGNSSIEYPYIVVKAALPKDMINSCVVRVCIQKEKEEELVHILEDKLKITIPTPIQGCHLQKKVQTDAGEPFCTGCVLRRWASLGVSQKCRYKYDNDDIEYEYCLDNNAQCVIISQGDNQQKIYDVVHRCIQEFNQKENTNITVWCEGHLPLRKITVGPCMNQENVIQSIRHYCKHTYWLRDVEITASSIPYRRAL
ncbi:MAG: DUF2971 domain-containing protein [Lachnospiraceae bacterium]|nr:DUF2971 domain-containing protein [Lachnospiraceae bacterium]